MPFDPTLAAVRFGSGLSPIFARPSDVDAILADLDVTPPFAIPVFSQTVPTIRDLQLAAKARREARRTPEGAEKEDAFRELRLAANEIYDQGVRATVARHVDAKVGFAARLTDFWADHFTVLARNNIQRHLVAPYVEEAIRSHIGGSFVDMIQTVMTHPMMLLYLEQFQSMGPQSRQGKRLGRGINENLAREMLELHTLGVGGSYDQTDVRELAELLTGLTYQSQRGFFYDDRFAEPGAETVLGVTYDAADGLPNVLAAIRDLALHPETAQHVCGKLAAYFVGTDPDPAMVAAMASTFLTTEGWLPSVYAEMLAHEAAWSRELRQIKSPLRYVTSGLRALGVEGAEIVAFDGRATRQILLQPLRVMGQPWEGAVGPDGWPDNGADWVNPQGMAGRINWAMSVPRRLLQRAIPDPRVFVQTALGDLAGQDVIFAASAAESKFEGVGVVLAAPAFQRS